MGQSSRRHRRLSVFALALVWFGSPDFFLLSFSLMIVFFFSFFDLKEAPIISDKKCSLHLFVLFNFTVVDIC